MLTQAQANALITDLKEAARNDAFEWLESKRHDELFVSVTKADLHFVLTLNRNPFEIRLHIRTKRDNIGIMRIDGAPYHANPDGTELRDTAHIHVYREGYGLSWADPIDWYDPSRPIQTLERFLDEVHARFPNGIQTTFN